MRTVGAYRTKGGFRYATYLMTLVGLSLLPFLARAQQPLFGLSSDANIPAVRGQHEGADSGIAARFFILRPTNRSNALEVFTAGRGRAAYLRIDNPSNPSNALEVLTVGTGAALWGQAPTLAIFGYARATTGTPMEYAARRTARKATLAILRGVASLAAMWALAQLQVQNGSWYRVPLALQMRLRWAAR